MIRSMLLITALFLGSTGQAKDVLDNAKVLELSRSGLSAELIVTLIEASPTAFDTDVETILKLRNSGLPDNVLQAMIKSASQPVKYSPRTDGRLLVYVQDSDSWSVDGGISAGDAWGIGNVEGGARPQTAEIIKTFHERCPDVELTSQQEMADFTVILEHEGGKGLIRRDNKVVLFDVEGVAVYSGSTRTLGNAVKNVCNEIRARAARL